MRLNRFGSHRRLFASAAMAGALAFIAAPALADTVDDLAAVIEAAAESAAATAPADDPNTPENETILAIQAAVTAAIFNFTKNNVVSDDTIAAATSIAKSNLPQTLQDNTNVQTALAGATTTAQAFNFGTGSQTGSGTGTGNSGGEGSGDTGGTAGGDGLGGGAGGGGGGGSYTPG